MLLGLGVDLCKSGLDLRCCFVDLLSCRTVRMGANACLGDPDGPNSEFGVEARGRDPNLFQRRARVYMKRGGRQKCDEED